MDGTVRAFLGATPIGVVATMRPDGCPRKTTLYLVRDGDTIWLSTEAGRAKAHDVERTGRASPCVVGPVGAYPSVTVEEPATIQCEDVAPMTAGIVGRITGGEPPELAEADLTAAGRVLLRIDIERIHGASNLPIVEEV